MTPYDRLCYVRDEAERLHQWAYDQAQMAYDVDQDSHRLAKAIDAADEALRLNLNIAEAEYAFEAMAAVEPPSTRLRRVNLTGFEGDNQTRTQ